MTLIPAASFAQSSSMVRWNSVIGVITAPGVDNPVAGISSGTLPWTTTRGRAQIDLSSGSAFFEVEGLVFNGGPTGTTGPVVDVVGTFVCNPNTPNQTLRDTPAVTLTSTGDAIFMGTLGGMPASCSNPLFLIRIGPSLPGAAGRWLAAGAVRQSGAVIY